MEEHECGPEPLTQEEKTAIAALKRIAAKWPESLWLYSGSGSLHIMKKLDGERSVTESGGVNPDFIVASLNIENDGGDW